VDLGQEPLGVFHCQRHRQDLAEGREDEDRAEDLDDEAVPVTEELVGGEGRERRGGDVDQRDPDEQRHEELVRSLDERLHRLGLGRLGRRALEPRAAEREVGGLRAREEGGARDEHEEAEELRDQAVAHARPVTKCSNPGATATSRPEASR